MFLANQMQRKLDKNSHKMGLDNCSLQYLTMRLTQERKELNKAIKNKDKWGVIEECADMANFLMFIMEYMGDDSRNWLKED